jgi:hypothetical protein
VSGSVATKSSNRDHTQFESGRNIAQQPIISNAQGLCSSFCFLFLAAQWLQQVYDILGCQPGNAADQAQKIAFLQVIVVVAMLTNSGSSGSSINGFAPSDQHTSNCCNTCSV